jgi:hypothetical protein
MFWFGVWWGHDTDVSRKGCSWMGSTTRHVSFYASLIGEVYVSQGPHQGATVVFGYIEGSFLVSKIGDVLEHYAPNIYRCIHT